MNTDESKLSVRILPGVHEVAAATWDSLVSPGDSPFAEHAWLALLESTGCVGRGTGWLPCHLSLWAEERLVAVSPSYVKEHSEGEFVFDWAWAEFAQRIRSPYYPKMVVAVPFTPVTGGRVLAAPGVDRPSTIRAMAEAARRRCESTGASGVHVLFPHASEADAWLAAGYLGREGFQYHWFRNGASTFEDYLQRFSSKHRNQVRRELRAVAERGIRVDLLTPEQHGVELARVMYSFYRSTIEKHGPW